MSTGDIAETIAWIVSAIIAAWMLRDMVKVGRSHDEDFLTASAEELDEAPLETSPDERPRDEQKGAG